MDQITSVEINQEGQAKQQVNVNRPAYLVSTFDKEFAIEDRKKRDKKETKKKHFLTLLKKINPIRIFSIVYLFAEYNFKQYLIPDLLSGITGTLNLITYAPTYFVLDLFFVLFFTYLSWNRSYSGW